MLVITLQFSYTQETINNALMKTAMFKKKREREKKTTKKITLPHSLGIDCSVEINTLHCPAN